MFLFRVAWTGITEWQPTIFILLHHKTPRLYVLKFVIGFRPGVLFFFWPGWVGENATPVSTRSVSVLLRCSPTAFSAVFRLFILFFYFCFASATADQRGIFSWQSTSFQERDLDCPEQKAHFAIRPYSKLGHNALDSELEKRGNPIVAMNQGRTPIALSASLNPCLSC